MTKFGIPVLAVTLSICGTSSLAGCGADPDPCTIPSGSYHAVPAEGAAIGALMFLHGWGSSGLGSLRMTGMVQTFTQAGYVVITPNGTPREGRTGRGWSFHPDRPAPRDENVFLQTVRDDAAARFGFDADAVLLSGFSIGGSMASYVACHTPAAFAAYAPVGGGLWRPHPDSCAGPVKLLHTHGWKDGTVPLEGRVLRGGSFQDPDALIQGDVFATFERWRVANECINHKPDRFAFSDTYWRRAWDNCAPGSALEFAMHAGGHSVPKGWAAMALEWFENTTAPE
ncbi:MAG: PHB depolymerase family esterase [Paracoccaceae bacterium]